MPLDRFLPCRRRWYRPQNMALVAVGDFPDPDRVVALIVAALDPPQPRPEAPLPSRPE